MSAAHRYAVAPHSSMDVPSSIVDISVACSKLAGSDVLSKSDPMVVLFIAEFGNGHYTEFGRTERISNNHNPVFAQKFQLKYLFEERQKLRFEVYDCDSSSSKLKDHDFLGRFDCSLGEAVSAGKTTGKLTGTSKDGQKICLIVEEQSSMAASKELYTLQFASELTSKGGLFSSPSLRFEIHRQSGGSGNNVVVYKSECNSKRPCHWRPFELTLGRLCGGDGNRENVLLIKVFDGSSLMSEFQTTLLTLAEGPGPSTSFTLTKVGNPGKNKGRLWLTKFNQQHVYSFMDFVQSGTQLSCTIAIDFTQSNGDVNSPDSLHCMLPNRPNQYMQALQAVGNIIQDYDTDKMFPVLGFGAKLPNGQVSHEFFVNGDASNPFCHGVNGVLEAYQTCLRNVSLWGPTNFAPVVSHVARIAASSTPNASNYQILVILTDGAITDMQKTTEALVNASSLPMSVIIVGVGNADFGSMHVFDADDKKLSSKGRAAVRDIVQFVPFLNFATIPNPQQAGAALAREVLAEIPQQLVGYMRMNNLQPLKNPEEVRQNMKNDFGFNN